jgi:hypothetical protein
MENKNNFFLPKNLCEIQVRILLVCALYSIKYGIIKPLTDIPQSEMALFNALEWWLMFQFSLLCIIDDQKSSFKSDIAVNKSGVAL